MIKRIVTNDFWHDDHVSDAVNEIQEAGYEVTSIRKVRRMGWLLCDDVTDIHYE